MHCSRYIELDVQGKVLVEEYVDEFSSTLFQSKVQMFGNLNLVNVCQNHTIYFLNIKRQGIIYAVELGMNGNFQQLPRYFGFYSVTQICVRDSVLTNPGIIYVQTLVDER